MDLIVHEPADHVANFARTCSTNPRPVCTSPIFHENPSPDEPELSYELLRVAHGRGYATEASRAAVTWARAAGYRRLWGTVWDWNVL
ncbi:GNAT family N-acetyltransferase [Kibdelosporangium aridum]|uniref:GNAT family N-acetyltransferase n=1 Tax=Kibdelosporangium aridum TaxID=2030 RepID=UPI002E124CE0